MSNSYDNNVNKGNVPLKTLNLDLENLGEKDTAYRTLAVEEKIKERDPGDIPVPSDEEIVEGREWVNYNQL